MTRRKRRGMARWVWILPILVAAAGAYLLLGGTPSPTPKALPSGLKVRDKPLGPMTEAEREAYVRDFVRVEEVRIEPDQDPDGNPVPGLMRVYGIVINKGEREVHRVVFTIVPKDASGQGMAAYNDDVVHQGGPLGPGQERDFSFTIPKREGFSGQFDQAVR